MAWACISERFKFWNQRSVPKHGDPTMFKALAAAPDKPQPAWDHFSVSLPVLKKTPLYFLSQKNSSPYILEFWKGKKKPKWIFFEAETLTRYLGSSLKLHLLCLLKPSILIWRTGVPASPFLALSLSNTHGFPFHTFSPFFCHFHFTKLREGFGHSKKENKTKIAEKAEMPKWKNQIWEFCLMKQKTISFAAQLNFHFFLLMDIGGVLLLTWHKPPW